MCSLPGWGLEVRGRGVASAAPFWAPGGLQPPACSSSSEPPASLSPGCLRPLLPGSREDPWASARLPDHPGKPPTSKSLSAMVSAPPPVSRAVCPRFQEQDRTALGHLQPTTHRDQRRKQPQGPSGAPTMPVRLAPRAPGLVGRQPGLGSPGEDCGRVWVRCFSLNQSLQAPGRDRGSPSLVGAEQTQVTVEVNQPCVPITRQQAGSAPQGCTEVWAGPSPGVQGSIPGL